MLKKAETACNGEHVQLEDLIGMIKNAEKNILLLNQARLHSLNDDIRLLKQELINLKETDQLIAEDDVSKISSLKLECRDLWAKVGNLHELLDKATKQADEAVSVLQQNYKLRRKVDRMEESLEEAKLSRISSETRQQYNDLMQQKMAILEEHLASSDEEIHSHVQLYQESIKEFQDILDTLKEESKRKALDDPADDMPWEFWSRILLMIGGWFLEKKISSPTSPGLHIIHIAVEMAPVAKVGGLGDVVFGLGKALQKKGHLVEIVIPKYDCLQYDHLRDLRGGRGLHSTLNSHSKKFIEAWDPATDNFLKVQFNADGLQGKMENKEYLGMHLKLSSADSMQPLVGCISRLVPPKGVHLIRQAIYRTLELGGQFVLLGSSLVEHIQREFEGIAKHFESHPRIWLTLKYDEVLSLSIYAASDMFIIPSLFEPCGLTQMIAVRYGSLPIVRKRGGLNDSVFDVDDDAIPLPF